MLIPPTLTIPDVLFVSPDKIFIKVLFPAPFGPKRPNIEPSGMERSIKFKAKLFFSTKIFNSKS